MTFDLSVYSIHMATEEQFAIDIHYNKLLGEANPDPPAILIKQSVACIHTSHVPRSL